MRRSVSLLLMGLIAGVVLIALLTRPSDPNDTPVVPIDQALRGLPYAPWVPVDEAGSGRRGVTIFQQDKIQKGHNLYSVPEPDLRQAFLIDITGNMLHAWSTKHLTPKGELQHVEFGPDKALFGIVYTHAIIKLTRTSDVEWIVEAGIHHDLDFDEGGYIYTLLFEGGSIRKGGIEYPILNDNVLIIDPDGKQVRKISMLPILESLITQGRLDWMKQWMEQAERNGQTDGRKRQRRFDLTPDTAPDVFHLNSIQVLPRSVSGLGEKGDFLVSIRELDLVAVIDRETETLQWSWGQGIVQSQHHATLLENNNILIFDNGKLKERSRVIEVDPRLEKIVWQYEGDPPGSFFSPSRGAAQRLGKVIGGVPLK